MSIVNRIVCHIKLWISVWLGVEAFVVASVLSDLYLHWDPLNAFVTAITPYIMDIVEKILSVL